MKILMPKLYPEITLSSKSEPGLVGKLDIQLQGKPVYLFVPESRNVNKDY
jgi:hypothetical protein